ncbi:ABC transporter permease [Chryseolinea sp. H1M3-3]|uniref:ABC transporter permease n=1 Tax=Chryseolinea sp. H1M3-3 TaxID=3034144 RepID=UPI0023EAFEE7|nr:ABC transporter permease [Chryseolinea sp. H1M3-3]
MSGQLQALKAELIKSQYANILWITFIAFGLAPVMGGVFMLIMTNPDAIALAGPLKAKSDVMHFSADWKSYFELLTQAIGVGGVLVFGFIASWIFGREYSEGTAKDLLALPTSRTQIINAKFFIYGGWSFALVISNLLLGLLIGTLLQISDAQSFSLASYLFDNFVTTVLTILLGTPIAFFAIWGKGYLAPLGVVALALVFSQVIAAAGFGYYFPWSVPGLFSGAGGIYKAQLNSMSYTILILTSFAGYVATVFFWKLADQTK